MTDNENKLYTVVRADISPGYQVAQTLHAVTELARLRPNEIQRHYELGNTVVCLEVPNEQELFRLYERVRVLTPTAIFWEPDINAYTAFASAPSPFHTLFRYLPLAGHRAYTV